MLEVWTHYPNPVCQIAGVKFSPARCTVLSHHVGRNCENDLLEVRSACKLDFDIYYKITIGEERSV